MQEYLGELSGMLARKQQRKNTVLSLIHQQALLDQRASTYGFSIRPHNPAQVSDPKAVKHFLNEVRGEIGHKISRINNPMLCSMDRDGETVVRQHNDDIHRLLIARNRWLVRCAEVGVELTSDEQSIVDKDRARVRLRKTFFGCANELPEARKQAEEAVKRPREEHSADATADAVDAVVDDEEVLLLVEEDLPHDATSPTQLAENEQTLGDAVIAAYVSAVRLAHDACHAPTLSTEEGIRRREEASASQWRDAHDRRPLFDISGYTLDFCDTDDGTPNIASDDEVRKQLLERKKLAMKSQLSSMAKR